MKDAYVLQLSYKTLLGDLITPVSAYLRLRSVFLKTFLLESADSRGGENSMSYICCNPFATFSAEGAQVTERYPCGHTQDREVDAPYPNVLNLFRSFQERFSFKGYQECAAAGPTFFGYSSYRAAQYFEDITFRASQFDATSAIPDLFYSLFEYVLAFDHFRDQIYLMHWKGENLPLVSFYDSRIEVNSLDDLERIITHRSVTTSPFKVIGEEQVSIDDSEYSELVVRCKAHIQRGDVFQIVPSRKFTQSFEGDDFQVYRVLRSINPSPYLFYFNFGDFRLFGSSPESQISISRGEARIAPIAGTLPRREEGRSDKEMAEKLLMDPKENAEHVMLVDLARNDLSRHCSDVRVEAFKEVHFYSHVIHLVSSVCGRLHDSSDSLSVFADTFPAGTLTGAPKYRAMELIDEYEPTPRTFYGGAIGYFGIDGSVNHAILIRSFLSKEGVLVSQAGAGIVIDSQEHQEAKETLNKLGALREAVRRAGEITL
jgi:anthranilate synthase component I